MSVHAGHTGAQFVALGSFGTRLDAVAPLSLPAPR